ncbi:MAG: hypothetical protein M1834_000288 [Cirrosporium novae-zelandiae]|nr:MAG: hypothetical protein M1834_000288 [Cirrosporium novae-zelandiae]
MLTQSSTAEKHRRKSLGAFRDSLRPLTPVHNKGGGGDPKKLKRHSFFSSSSLSSNPPSPNLDNDETSESPKSRPRVLTKAEKRPSSFFGSLRSLKSMEDEERLAMAGSKASSIEDATTEFGNGTELGGKQVLQHGEVQTTGGMFRKKTQYLVLTESNLIRFKSRHKASEVFSSISSGRNSTLPRHTPGSSYGSLPDMQVLLQPVEGYSVISLESIIAVYRLDDGKPYFSIEIAYLDEISGNASSMILQITEFRECEKWLTTIRTASQAMHMQFPPAFSQRSVNHAAIALERERDYDPHHFQMFSVVQRSNNKSASRSSSEDLAKLCSTICYLVVGLNKVHLVPLPRSSNRASSSSLNELEKASSFGITTLIQIYGLAEDDAFQLVFRVPLRQEMAIYLASSAAREIIQCLRHASEFLRPEWLEQPYSVDAPEEWADELERVYSSEQDLNCFDRTLSAYCAGYGIDTSNIRYEVDYECEDAPCFRLLYPGRRRGYTNLELIAIIRSLRYNEYFGSISFADISLDPICNLRDSFGIDIGYLTTRSGSLTNIVEDLRTPTILLQELRALALKSKKLRRLDFSNSISRIPLQDDSRRDPGCGIPEALFPLCCRHLTNVDWVILNGIKLGDTDLDYLVDAAAQKACHLRALEVSNCGLRDHELDLILTAMYHQENTLEAIDISANQVRLNPETFQDRIGHFGHIRRINLSRTQRTSGSGSLISPETLLAWRLEEMDFSGTALNEQTVDSISVYLSSPQSATLRLMKFDQCSLTGKDVATFMHCMCRTPGHLRDLHLHVSQNRLGENYSEIFDAIAQDATPTRLTMKMIDYKKEEHFRILADALRRNTTLRYLDISKASLPYDASDETCDVLRQMFAENNTLQELNISGEHAHLDIARFGIGLNHALTGLRMNTSLKVLRIEYQKLGLQGANTLASVLEENCGLEEIYCDHNEINLQSFTVLVNGLKRNRTVLFLPVMEHDRNESIQKVEREIQAADVGPQRATPLSTLSTAKAVRRSFSAALGSKTNIATSSVSGYTVQDVQAALNSLNEKWDAQTERLRRYLVRNFRIVNGVSGEPPEWIDELNESRPVTATSIGQVLNRVKIDTTPTLERELDFMNIKTGE